MKCDDVVYEVGDVRRACVDMVSGSVMYRCCIRGWLLLIWLRRWFGCGFVGCAVSGDATVVEYLLEVRVGGIVVGAV